MKLEDKKVILKKIKRLPDQIENYTICSFKKDRSIKAYTQNTEKGIIYFLNEEGYDTQTFMFTEKKTVVLVNFNILKNISKFLQNVVVLDLIEHCKPVICFQIYSLAL